MEPTLANKPSSTFTLKINGEDQKLIMSYALFTEIMKVIPSPEQMIDMSVRDPYLRDYIVRRVLTGSKPVKDDNDLIDPFTLDIDFDDVNSLVEWVSEHVLYFFMKSAEKSGGLAKRYQSQVQEIIQSNQLPTGSAD